MFKNLVHATALATAITSASFAQEMVYPDTLIVLDVSNSMWGQIDGIPKISIAKNVIGNLVDSLETDSEFGLLAFGHRRKSDCSDIELVLPIGPLDSDRFAAAMDSLTPHGRTPLTAALQEAAQILKTDTRSGRIILISDGIESCEADPCALAKELEKTGLDFTMHVIGFDVTEAADQRQLSCIANSTEGLYLTAKSTSELKDALETMMMDDQEAHGDSADGTTMDALAGNATGDTVHAAAVVSPQSVQPNTRFSVDWTGPAADGDYIALVSVDAESSSATSSAKTAEGWPAMLTAPQDTGPYEVRYISGADGAVLAADTVTIQEK